MINLLLSPRESVHMFLFPLYCKYIFMCLKAHYARSSLPHLLKLNATLTDSAAQTH